MSTDWRLGYDQKFDAQINPFLAQLSSSYFVFTETYDLLPYNWDLADAGPDPEHSLVTSHEVSDDGLEYIFHLREGVKWSDGEDFTADDFVFSYEAVQGRHERQRPRRLRLLDGLDREDRRLHGPLHAQATRRPRPVSLRACASRAHLGDVPLDGLSRFAPCCPIVGTGPYVIASDEDYDPKGTTILTPNEYFWGAPGQIERILMIMYGEKEGPARAISS